MIYLALSVLCSVLIANALMVFGKRGKLSVLPIFLGNYFVASLFSYASLPAVLPRVMGFDFALGIVAGALFLGNFWVYQRSISFNGLSLSVGAMRIAMIIPVLLSVGLFQESISGYNQLGIVIGLLAFGLKTKLSELHNLLWIIGLFLVSGLTDSTLKIYKELGSGQEALFVYLIFTSAFVWTLLAIIIGKTKVPWQSILFGFALGIPNRLSTVFFLNGLDSVPASLAYPLVAVSVVLLSIVSDLVFWKKKAGLRDVILWALLIVSLLLLNLKA